MPRNKTDKYKKYFKKKPTTFRSRTDEIFEQRAIYESNLLSSWEQLFIFPSKTVHVEGGFWYSLGFRCLLLMKEDFYHLRNFYKSHFYKKFSIYRVFYIIFLWLLLIPPAYYSYLTIRYIIWRSPFYFFSFIESFFENYIFIRYPSTDENQWINFIYNRILLKIKGFLIDSWGLGFLRKFFKLPLKGGLFIEFVWRKKGRPHWERFLFYISDLERRFRYAMKEIDEVGLFPYLIGLDTYYKWRKVYRQYRFLIVLNDKGRKWLYAFWIVTRNHIYRTLRIIRLHIFVERKLLPLKIYKFFVTKWYDYKIFSYTLLPRLQYHMLRPLPYIIDITVFVYRIITVIPVYIINYFIPLKNNVPTFEYLRRKSLRLNRKATAFPGLANHKLQVLSRNPYYRNRIKRLQAVGALPKYAEENNGRGWLWLFWLIVFIFVIFFHIKIVCLQYVLGLNLLDLPFLYYLYFIL